MFTSWGHPLPSTSSVGSERRPRRERCCKRRALPTVPAHGITDFVTKLSDVPDDLKNALLAETGKPHFGTAAVSTVVDRVASLLPDSAQFVTAINDITNASMSGSPLAAVPRSVEQISSSFSSLQQSLSAAASPILLPPQLSLPASQISDLEPHFGTKAVTDLLQQATQSLSAQIPALSTIDPRLAQQASSTMQQLQHAADLVNSFPATAASSLLSSPVGLQLSKLTSTLTGPLASALQSLSAASAAAASGFVPPEVVASSVAAALADAQANGVSGIEFGTFCLVAAGAMAAIGASVPGKDFKGVAAASEGKLVPEYNPEYLEQYFERRPIQVMARTFEVASTLTTFGLSLLSDLWTGTIKANEAQRAEQLREGIEKLGPAYVKVAQALSTRVDLLAPAYFEQIQMLQDQVPAFPNNVARLVIQQELGTAVESVFAELSESPVAAASLGQVYRGTLREKYGGGEVAVKVQRPGVLEQVALDLHLMRQAAIWVCKDPEVKTDWTSLIDTWAVRFFHEMDYIREANNAAVFKQQMAGLEGIVVPDTYPEITTNSILVSTWIEGEKLSESKAGDVRELCNTLLNAYLIQLLETGFLHADPHPGNLVRTPDGKIAILDYGLMTEVTEDQRLALVDYIAHLLTEDWPNVALDLQRLDFIPADMQQVQESGLVEPLGRILVKLSGGGGATKLNIDQVMSELEDLGRDYPFRVPGFFALILRAFSVIEGIALGVDGDYAIVQECFPYISRRLLSDDAPRTKKVLRDVLYGGKQRLDVERLGRLAEAFQAFTTEGLEENKPVGKAKAIDPTLREALVTIFSRRGSYVQELLVEEVVTAVDALSREALSALLVRLLGSPPAAATLTTVESLGPLRPLLLPFLTPPEILSRLAPVVALTKEDEEALSVVRGIFNLVQRVPAPDIIRTPQVASDLARVAPELAPLLQDLAPGLVHTGELFVRLFLKRLALRFAAEVAQPDDTAMAALGFMPLANNPITGLRAGSTGSTASAWNSTTQPQLLQQLPSSFQQQQLPGSGVQSFSERSGGAQLPAALQLPLALAALPLLPLAMLAQGAEAIKRAGEKRRG